MTSPSKLLGWRLCCIGFIALSIVAFTSLVIPAGVYDPFLLGMPLTLWRGVLVVVGFVLLAAIGSYFQPIDDLTEEGEA